MPPTPAPAPKAIILTAGDVSVDWLWFDLSDEDQQARRKEWKKWNPGEFRKWLGRSQVVSAAVHGGAWFLDTFTRMLAGWAHEDFVFGYARYPSAALRQLTTAAYVHTDTGYESKDYTPGSREKGEKTPKAVYRVKTGPTYSGPMNLVTAAHPGLTGLPWAAFSASLARRRAARAAARPPGRKPDDTLLPGEYPVGLPTVLLLHDESNGFSQTPTLWTDLLHPAPPATGPDLKAVILNLSNREGHLGVLADPKARDGAPANELWKSLTNPPGSHADRLVVVTQADDLREVDVRVSRSLSWERTALDLAAGFQSHPVLRELGKARHVVVRFGVSGAFHAARRADGTTGFTLYYDPAHLEGEYRDKSSQGDMIGYSVAFAATLATEVRAALVGAAAGGDWSAAVAAAVRTGVANCRAFFLHGFGPVARGNHDRLAQWDQIGNPAAPPTYPPELTTQGTYRGVDSGGPGHLVTFRLTPAELLPFQLGFFPKWITGRTDTVRNSGCELIDPEGVLLELKKRMEAVFAADRKAYEDSAAGKTGKVWAMDWERRTSSDRVIVCSVTGDPAHWPSYVAHLIPRLRKPLSAKVAKRPPHKLSPVVFKQYADEVSSEVVMSLEWDYGWPVRVRAFAADVERVASAELPPDLDPDWEILGSEVKTLLHLAQEIVEEGAKAALAKARKAAAGGDGRFPVAEFGKLRTADRWEGESYRSIRNLIREYLDKPNPARPLSIAVFGPPGGGKSFGVKQIAQSLGKDRVVEDENNLSQFASPADLSTALIRARDKAVGGKLPLVFFDEFDAAHESEPLAWLKYFLSVMQDGTHRYAGGDLRVGPAILVFAGGTSRTFRAFARADGDGAVTEAERKLFADAKGPDFVSRLRGHVNIIGPNPQTPDGRVESDPGCLIRRALTLDHQLRQHHARLEGPDKKLRIDPDVLRVLLRVPKFTHGSRSVEAVVETSALVGADRFDKSALLPAEQLAMHLEWGDGKRWEDFLAELAATP